LVSAAEGTARMTDRDKDFVGSIPEIYDAFLVPLIAVAYCQGTPLRNEIEERDASLLEHVTDCAANAIAERFKWKRESGISRATRNWIARLKDEKWP